MAEPDRHGQRAGARRCSAPRSSPIVREAGDLANAVFDRRGRMVAQAVTGTPGHINSLARAASAILDEYPTDSLVEGDVLITNDPYKTAGQLLDVTVLYPVFRDGRVIAFFGSTIHHTDVGGYGIGAGGRDVFEEGLWIPICKLMIAGRAQRRRVEVHPLQRPPARPHGRRPARPDGVSGEVGAQRLHALCDRHGLDDIEALADEIIERSRGGDTRQHPRAAGRHVPRRSAMLDLADGSQIDIVCAMTVDPDARRDHRRLRRARRARARTGINVVRELHPRLHDVHGALRAQPGAAEQPRQPGADQGRSRPRASIVNAVSPQPCTARHVVGMFLPNALLKALAQIKPEQSMAEGSGAVWTMQVSGNHDDGRPFITAMFTYAGGVGARATKPGLVARARTRRASPRCRSRWSRRRPRSASCARSCAPAAAAAGGQIGGLGQTIEFTVDTTRPWQLNAVTSRLADAAAGHLRRRARRRRMRSRVNGEAGHARRPASRCSPATSCASTCRAAAATARVHESDGPLSECGR